MPLVKLSENPHFSTVNCNLTKETELKSLLAEHFATSEFAKLVTSSLSRKGLDTKKVKKFTVEVSESGSVYIKQTSNASRIKVQTITEALAKDLFSKVSPPPEKKDLSHYVIPYNRKQKLREQRECQEVQTAESVAPQQVEDSSTAPYPATPSSKPQAEVEHSSSTSPLKSALKSPTSPQKKVTFDKNCLQDHLRATEHNQLTIELALHEERVKELENAIADLEAQETRLSNLSLSSVLFGSEEKLKEREDLEEELMPLKQELHKELDSITALRYILQETEETKLSEAHQTFIAMEEQLRKAAEESSELHGKLSETQKKLSTKLLDNEDNPYHDIKLKLFLEKYCQLDFNDKQELLNYLEKQRDIAEAFFNFYNDHSNDISSHIPWSLSQILFDSSAQKGEDLSTRKTYFQELGSKSQRKIRMYSKLIKETHQISKNDFDNMMNTVKAQRQKLLASH